MITFETAAVKEFPELANTKQITRKQINEIVAKTGARYPTHIANPNNTIRRGLFKFEFQDSVIELHIPEIKETDEELDNRIKETYHSMEILVNSVAKGISPSLIISGAPGIGKSHGVIKVLDDHNRQYEIHRGFLKATHLFRMLWENREKGQTIIIDDCDGIFDDLTALNLLKAALEIKEDRLIGWGSEKEFEDNTGEVIPRYFMFNGSVIFLTNINFSAQIKAGGKLAPHLNALDSRALQFEMNINTPREVFSRIKQVVSQSDINEKHGINKEQSKKMLHYIETNLTKMKEVSIRSYEKLAALVKTDPLFWESLANRIMIRN
jgi:Cdc6-like AAA superfamily ATPase